MTLKANAMPQTTLLSPPRRAASFNKPAASNAGIASRLTVGRQLPGVPEPGR